MSHGSDLCRHSLIYEDYQDKLQLLSLSTLARYWKVLSPLMSPFCLYLPFGGCKGMICSVSIFQPFILDCRIVPMITAYTVYHRKPYMKDWHQRPMDVIQHFAWVCDLWWYIHVIVFVLSINMCSSLRLKKMKEARHACGVNEYNYLLKVGPFPWYPASWWPDYKVHGELVAGLRVS